MRKSATLHDMSAPPLLDFRHLTVCRDDHVVLDDFSLHVPARQNVVVLGPNGSGKSTLIKLITRELYPVARPESLLRVLGRDRWLLFELREHLGVVSNDLMVQCTRDVSGLDLVLAGFFGAVELWPHHDVTAAMRERAHQALDALEVSHLAGRRLTQMSSGEARRLLIARALAHEPRALVLDEPTNSLDLRAFRELRDVLRRLAQGGTTIVLVTHHLPDIVPEIDRVVMLASGRIVADGPVAEVVRADVLERVFGVPVRVERRDGYYEVY